MDASLDLRVGPETDSGCLQSPSFPENSGTKIAPTDVVARNGASTS